MSAVSCFLCSTNGFSFHFLQGLLVQLLQANANSNMWAIFSTHLIWPREVSSATGGFQLNLSAQGAHAAPFHMVSGDAECQSARWSIGDTQTSTDLEEESISSVQESCLHTSILSAPIQCLFVTSDLSSLNKQPPLFLCPLDSWPLCTKLENNINGTFVCLKLSRNK